jgi:hypothetical protein
MVMTPKEIAKYDEAKRAALESAFKDAEGRLMGGRADLSLLAALDCADMDIIRIQTEEIGDLTRIAARTKDEHLRIWCHQNIHLCKYGIEAAYEEITKRRDFRKELSRV